jgi:hypothetical protein
MAHGWAFRGIGLIKGLGHVKQGLRPRGRARLLLQRRSDKKLLLRSEWIDMEATGLPISWLLRGLRGAPFHDQIEATFCVNSPPGQVTSFPKGLPLLDCKVDAKGNACMTWSWQWKQGYHERKDAAIWQPDAPYREGAGGSANAPVATAPAPAKPAPAQPATPPPAAKPDADANTPSILQSELFRGVAELERIASGHGVLKWGSKGEGAKALQKGLIALGYDVPGGADGAFGKGTAVAVEKFQAEEHLGADGIAGAGTVKAMDARLSKPAG